MSGYPLDRDEERAERIAAQLISPRGDVTERERLVLRRADRPTMSDDEHAEHMVRLLLSELDLSLETERNAFLHWMTLHTARLVFSDRGRRLIEALIPPLLEHEVLGGRAVRRIFAEFEGRLPRARRPRAT